MDKVSVIIPIYNVENYLRRAVGSVLNQTHTNLEVILINDGSTDNSGEICNEYKKDERVKVVHKENGGVSSARNLGLEMASGDYIAFLDPDDYIDQTMYEKLIEAIKSENADIALCAINQFYEDGKIKPLKENNLLKINCDNIYSYFIKDGCKETDFEKSTDKVMGCVWRTLYKKEVVKNLRFEQLAIAEDLVFTIDVFSQKIKFAIVNEPLYYYFQRNTSVMNTFSEKRLNNQINGLKTVLERINGKVLTDQECAYKFYIYSYCVNLVLKNNRKDLLNKLKENEFIMSLNTKENYKAKKKQTNSFKRKIAFFLVHKKWFGLYSMLVKII